MSQNQNPNEIANPQSNILSQTKGPEMNDRDRMNDILNMEKYLSSNYATAAWEASHDRLHQDYISIFNDIQQQHRQLFNAMFQQGWYKLEAEQQQKVDQMNQQFSNYATQFPYPANTTHA